MPDTRRVKKLHGQKYKTQSLVIIMLQILAFICQLLTVDIVWETAFGFIKGKKNCTMSL